jgi:hypothetical protein
MEIFCPSLRLRSSLGCAAASASSVPFRSFSSRSLSLHVGVGWSVRFDGVGVVGWLVGENRGRVWVVGGQSAVWHTSAPPQLWMNLCGHWYIHTHFSYSCSATLKSNASSRSLNATPMNACRPVCAVLVWSVDGDVKCGRCESWINHNSYPKGWAAVRSKSVHTHTHTHTQKTRRNDLSQRARTHAPWAFWILSTK